MRPLRFDLAKRAVALIITEGGRGPFAVMSEHELQEFLTLYRQRKIKTFVFRRTEGEEK